MVIVVFRTRLRPGADVEAHAQLAEEMRTFAREQPGFVSVECFTAATGDEVSLVFFESDEDVMRWRGHPEHVEAQRRGREEFYEWYSIHTSTVVRSHESRAGAADDAE